jgi:hypothetical protein
VENINLAGGSFLGVSRGGAKTSEIVDSIQVSNLHRHNFIFHGYVKIIIGYFKTITGLCRPEELICFLYLVEMVPMQEQMLYMMRFLCLYSSFQLIIPSFDIILAHEPLWKKRNVSYIRIKISEHAKM